MRLRDRKKTSRNQTERQKNVNRNDIKGHEGKLK